MPVVALYYKASRYYKVRAPRRFGSRPEDYLTSKYRTAGRLAVLTVTCTCRPRPACLFHLTLHLAPSLLPQVRSHPAALRTHVACPCDLEIVPVVSRFSTIDE